MNNRVPKPLVDVGYDVRRVQKQRLRQIRKRAASVISTDHGFAKGRLVLAYLSISTMTPAGICEYPDSKKVGAYAEGFRHMTRSEHNLDYWTDE